MLEAGRPYRPIYDNFGRNNLANSGKLKVVFGIGG